MRNLSTLLAVSVAWPSAGAIMPLETTTSSFQINEKGWLVGVIGAGRNYVASEQPSPLAQVRVAGEWLAPDGATWEGNGDRLTLRFAAGPSVTLKVEVKKTHVTFEVLDVQPRDQVELLLWGPYATTISEFIGEVVGVVRDSEFAIGIQALNSKTLGGHPERENDIDQEGSHDDRGRYADLPVELNRDQLYRGDTAWPTAFGSVLQAYCRHRDHDRLIANWGHERYLSPAYRDGGVVGSKIALFACSAWQALARIGDDAVSCPDGDGVVPCALCVKTPPVGPPLPPHGSLDAHDEISISAMR